MGLGTAGISTPCTARPSANSTTRVSWHVALGTKGLKGQLKLRSRFDRVRHQTFYVVSVVVLMCSALVLLYAVPEESAMLRCVIWCCAMPCDS
eukprot:5964638-Pyramimonas_sp.AAC.1